MVERPVVGGTEGRMPIRLVEAKHEGVPHAVLGHQRLELVVVADHPVDVPAEMEVRVENLGLRRQQGLHLPVVPGDELERASEGVGHP